MGGAFITVKAKTEAECRVKADEAIERAREEGLEDCRGVDYIELDDHWEAVIWMHS